MLRNMSPQVVQLGALRLEKGMRKRLALFKGECIREARKFVNVPGSGGKTPPPSIF